MLSLRWRRKHMGRLYLFNQPLLVYSWSSPHQNIQRSQKDAFGGRMKVETYCTGKKKKREREDGGKTHGEKRRERERERELFWVQDPRWAFLTEWRDPDGRELLASRWLTARFIRSGFVREAGPSFFSVSKSHWCFASSWKLVSNLLLVGYTNTPSVRLVGTRLCRRIWRLTSLHRRHGRQGERFRAGWCFLPENGMCY